MLTIWQTLQPHLPRRARSQLSALAASSLVAGLLEATVLVLIVHAALSLTAATGDPLELPVVGALELSTGSAIGFAAALAVATLLLHAAVARLAAHLTAGTLQRARENCIDAFAGASWERQSMEREGALQENTATLARETSRLVSALSRLVASAVALAAMLASALFVDWAAAVALMVFGGILALGMRPVHATTKRRSTAFVTSDVGFTETVAQWSSLALELRVFGVAEDEAARMRSAAASTSDKMIRSRFLRNLASSLYRDVATLLLVAGIALLTLVEDRDIAALGASVLVVLRSISYSQQASMAFNTVVDQAPSLFMLGERLHSLRTTHSSPGDVDVGSIERIRFDDVHYVYGDGKPGLRGVSLTIDQGETLGVIGPSGAGKTTLVQLVLGLRPPTSGHIEIDGVPSTRVSDGSWSRAVAFVPQAPNLFEGTISENIAFLRQGITRTEIERATEQAHLLHEVARMPEGLDTPLGPRGVGLSGGQRQRLAIARALVGRPQLIVLDEPTSALDPVSERLLVQTLSELHGRVTFVIVAHRIDTLRTCDRVLAMSEGLIVADGPLDEALAAVSFDGSRQVH